MATHDQQWFTEEELRNVAATKAYDERSLEVEKVPAEKVLQDPSRSAGQFGTEPDNVQASVSGNFGMKGYGGSNVLLQQGLYKNDAGQFSAVEDVSVDKDAKLKAFGVGGRWVGAGFETGPLSNVLAAEAKVIVDDHFKTQGQFTQAAVTWDPDTGLTSTNAVIETTKGNVATYHEFSKTSQLGDNPKYGDLTVEAHLLNPMFEKGKWVGGESNKIVGAGLQYTVPFNPSVNVAVGGGINAPINNLEDYSINAAVRFMTKDAPAVQAAARAATTVIGITDEHPALAKSTVGTIIAESTSPAVVTTQPEKPVMTVQAASQKDPMQEFIQTYIKLEADSRKQALFLDQTAGNMHKNMPGSDVGVIKEVLVDKVHDYQQQQKQQDMSV
jgi:hypothetical protein